MVAPVRVLFEDADLLAVDKPPALVIHPAYRHPDGTLFDAIVARQADRGEARPCLLHRLDRDTSGVVLFAKSAAARRGLVRQFERHQVRKWYLALVHGHPASSAGEVAEPLCRDPLDRRRVVVSPEGQAALTRYRVLAADGARALVLAAPRTGRLHQIRAHLAWLGHPIVGDTTYAPASPSAGEPDHADDHDAGPSPVPRQMLHAWGLWARHPVTGADLRIWAPLPPDLSAQLPHAWRLLCTPALAEDT
jgi:23S rRNA pseudouridine1911/1915/1917 synthase